MSLLVAGGTLGYSMIEGWSLSDSLYMTFITMTTVGFGEVKPLSEAGKHFTILFLIFSIATFGYSATILIAFIFEGRILELLQERRMTRRIKRLRDHYIICGGGDIGREVALEFKRFKARFVVIDRDPENSELAREESVLFVRGDAEDDEVLKEASIERARGLVAVLPNDETQCLRRPHGPAAEPWAHHRRQGLGRAHHKETAEGGGQPHYVPLPDCGPEDSLIFSQAVGGELSRRYGGGRARHED